MTPSHHPAEEPVECASPPCSAHEMDPVYMGLEPPPAVALPLLVHTVPPEWIDYNGHMNVAYYVMAFDQATDAVLDAVGLGTIYRAASGCSAFVLEMHVNYLRELTRDARLTIECRVLGVDAKRVHLFHTMHSDGATAATNELMLLHVDLGERRGRPFPPAVRARLGALLAAATAQPLPEQAGRRIALPTPAADA